MKARRIERENFYFLSIVCFHHMEYGNGNRYYYINDHLFTPQKMIDTSGNTVWDADWDSFGEVSLTVNTIENNLRFPGQYYDSETGFYYNFHRYYMPEVGRYLREDEVKSGVNLYLYAGNNGVINIDYLGLWIRPGCKRSCSIKVKCRPINSWFGRLAAFIYKKALHCYIVIKDSCSITTILEADDREGIDEANDSGVDLGGETVPGTVKKDRCCKKASCLVSGKNEFNSRRYSYSFYSKNCNFFVLWDWCKCIKEFLINLPGYTNMKSLGTCEKILSVK